MIQLSQFAIRILDRISMIGMWIAVVVSVRNFSVAYRQYRRTKGFIHLINIAQVIVLFIHRFIYGLVPVFEITTCAFWPLLVSLWHLDYVLVYLTMFKRLLILEAEKDSIWIKCVGFFLIALRFADWPYELAFYSLQRELMVQQVESGANCLAAWGQGVLILNFVSDALANLFLSGMFVRRLYVHIRRAQTVISHRNRVIEYIARKSLVCLTLTFIVNLVMNILKVTEFLGNRSDTFTVYFQVIESTLLVEALRIDHTYLSDKSFCEHCGMIMNSNSNGQKKSGSSQQKSSRLRSPATAYNPSISSDIPITTIRSHHDNYDHMH
ncbi:hypothetical protein G6F70_002725 [Rhizopus microsporus]|uniref:Uncharacterized protein n=3 Tax=Rhizopus TaxID=4842 RepID=A0A367JF90_RHIAZ|nr:hypothetical protein G6F71_003904 [Rhizopus microsporus]RCH88596.1 hypothetical protein CU097_010535 [Rhizopus azygosporus]KAG1201906.1 hypothetical protein G6F70_002725 [Rhizopus microsporus]KAG1210519.1 hypothetical protein G6F69_005405 [Rhizopus microsporus]KAG1232211.1 hypothetical protein G6F67_005178 [Rhizopus microsporus]